MKNSSRFLTLRYFWVIREAETSPSFGRAMQRGIFPGSAGAATETGGGLILRTTESKRSVVDDTAILVGQAKDSNE
ncbi:Hypothetical protein NTJ_01831 [Nesidiocoris tenuis]|uniref:Uncharacterized protein n=1 Tax=Nesidiocoris tenuis TaxID=355587 RepID=A0ABN7A9N4_9HEMI|nr:Hypothetical protein NTJ_01831 [Nesidiocoris tenuis]